jgi:DNA-binding transcriptional MerR regulator
MTDRLIEIVLARDELPDVTLEDLAHVCGVRREVLERFVDVGLLEPTRLEGAPVFTYEAVLRVRSIQRLRRELGVNLNGAAVILDLADRLRRLQRELDYLRAALGSDER